MLVRLRLGLSFVCAGTAPASVTSVLQHPGDAEALQRQDYEIVPSGDVRAGAGMAVSTSADFGCILILIPRLDEREMFSKAQRKPYGSSTDKGAWRSGTRQSGLSVACSIILVLAALFAILCKR